MPAKFLTAEWRYLAMLNYCVDPRLLEPHVPRGTSLDSWNGNVYVSVVGFIFDRTRVLGIAVPFHTKFEEVNLRFYVRRETGAEVRRGVTFLKELVPRFAIAALARATYNEPYEAVPMSHAIIPPSPAGAGKVEYRWRHAGNPAAMLLAPQGEPKALIDGSEEEFITEHYWGYTRQRDGSTIEYQVEHPRWRVWRVEQPSLDGDLTSLYGADLARALSAPPDSAFVADGSAIAVYQPVRLRC